MAKNKTPLKGEQHRDITQIAEQATSWIEKQSKFFVAGFIGISLVLGSVWAVSSMSSKNKEKMAKAAGVVNRKIELLEKSIKESQPKETEEQAKKDQFETRKKAEIAKISTDVKELINEFPSKVTTSYTVVKWSKFLVENDEVPQAYEILNTLNLDTQLEFSAVPLLMKAGVLAKQEKMDEALKIYDDILEVQSWKLFHNEALIQKAAILQSRGNIDEAIKLLSEVKGDGEKESKFVNDSKKYIRLLKINQNFGS